MLGIYLLNNHVEIPTKGTKHSACYDIKAYIQSKTSIKMWYDVNGYSQYLGDNTKVTIPPQTRALIPTGIIFSIPSGYSVRIHPRSGLALKNGITLPNSEGIIDSDYYDETFVCIVNNSDHQHIIENGDKIAQFELVRELEYDISQITTQPTKSTDRSGGFGHTGK